LHPSNQYGQESYYDSLYLLLERRLWQSEKLSTSEVMTFFTLCLRTGKAQTALKFIHEKKDSIFPPEIRPDAFNYSMAQYYFSCKNYDQVLSLLQQVEYVNVFYKISSKRLLIETFYELREWDSLESAMNAFRVFIHRNTEISDLHKKNNQNFINFLYKLINADSNKAPRRHRLQQALQRTPNIAERRWLMEQVEA
jgi:hypothetical protein